MDETVGGCHVEGCLELAVERAPEVFICERHWDALCEAYARQRVDGPLPAPAGRADLHPAHSTQH